MATPLFIPIPSLNPIPTHQIKHELELLQRFCFTNQSSFCSFHLDPFLIIIYFLPRPFFLPSVVLHYSQYLLLLLFLIFVKSHLLFFLLLFSKNQISPLTHNNRLISCAESNPRFADLLLFSPLVS